MERRYRGEREGGRDGEGDGERDGGGAFNWCSTAAVPQPHLWQVVNEEVASLRPLLLGRGWSLRHSTKHRAVGVGSVTLETSGVGPYGAEGEEEREGGGRERGQEGGLSTAQHCTFTWLPVEGGVKGVCGGKAIGG